MLSSVCWAADYGLRRSAASERLKVKDQPHLPSCHLILAVFHALLVSKFVHNTEWAEEVRADWNETKRNETNEGKRHLASTAAYQAKKSSRVLKKTAEDDGTRARLGTYLCTGQPALV